MDGVDIDLDALTGLKLHEVAKGLTLTGHMAFPAIAMINQDRWQDLSDKNREAVRNAMSQTLAWATAMQVEAEKNNLEKMKGTITVKAMKNAHNTFQNANAAFDEAFGEHALKR